VETHVGSDDLAPLAEGRGGLGCLHRGSQRTKPGGVQLGERAEDVALEDPPKAVQVNEIALFELRDEHAAIVPVDQQVVVSQEPECLTQRVAGDPQPRDQTLLAEPGAGGQVSLGDLPAKHARNPFRR